MLYYTQKRVYKYECNHKFNSNCTTNCYNLLDISCFKNLLYFKCILLFHSKHYCSTQSFISLGPRYTGVRPDIWLGLVSLGSKDLSCLRCGIDCNTLQSRATSIIYNIYLNNSSLEYINTIHEFIIH